MVESHCEINDLIQIISRRKLLSMVYKDTSKDIYEEGVEMRNLIKSIKIDNYLQLVKAEIYPERFNHDPTIVNIRYQDSEISLQCMNCMQNYSCVHIIAVCAYLDDNTICDNSQNLNSCKKSLTRTIILNSETQEDLKDIELSTLISQKTKALVFCRGYEYYQLSKIEEFILEDNSIEACVRSDSKNIAYEVSITKDEKLVHCKCDCPYYKEDFRICKHIVSVSLHADNLNGFLNLGKTETSNLGNLTENSNLEKLDQSYSSTSTLRSEELRGDFKVKIKESSAFSRLDPVSLAEVKSSLNVIRQIAEQNDYNEEDIIYLQVQVFIKTIRTIFKKLNNHFLDKTENMRIFLEISEFAFLYLFELLRDPEDSLHKVTQELKWGLEIYTRNLSEDDLLCLNETLNEHISGWGDIFEFILSK